MTISSKFDMFNKKVTKAANTYTFYLYNCQDKKTKSSKKRKFELITSYQKLNTI